MHFNNINDEILSYENRASRFVVEQKYFYNKTVENDLLGILNPILTIEELYSITDNCKKNTEYDLDQCFNRYMYNDIHRKKAIEQCYIECYVDKQKDLAEIGISYECISRDQYYEGLKARIYRTLFSVLTEYGFFLMSIKVFGETAVTRSIRDDLSGVDYKIYYNGQFYCIHIYVDTPRSRAYRQKKIDNKNSNNVIDGIHVDILYPTDDNNSMMKRLRNGFYVPTEKYILYFKSEIDKGNIKRNTVLYIK